jgi:DNA polymerase-1
MIRECFAARPGYTLVAGDFSQAELRWMGWFAQEPFLYEVYENDRDLHSEVAAAMFGLDFTKEHRIQTKMFNFAYAYGGTEYSFAADAALPIEKARAWVRQYNQLMPRAAAWKKETWDLVRAQGWLRTPTGRRRRFSLITPDKQHETHNQAINFPVQSISSDVTLMAFTNLCEYFRKMGWDAHGVLFLHDGIYFEVKNDPVLVKKVGAKVREVMLSTADYVQKGAGERFEEYRGFKYMPFKVDIDSGPNWGSLKKLEC